MKINRSAFLASSFLLILGLSVLFLPRLQIQKAAATHPDEAKNAVAAADDAQDLQGPFTDSMMGYIDCPPDLEKFANQGTMRPPLAHDCLDPRLPTGAAPEPFHANSTLAGLEALCGPVFSDFLFYMGEGQCRWGTVMYQGTERELQIAWKNWQEKKYPQILRFVGQDLHFDSGLHPGLLLSELVKINEKPITFTGFGWSSSGIHRSFQAGKLQDFDAPGSPYFIRYTLDWDLFDDADDAEHASVVVGDSPLESGISALEKYRAQVESIDYHFAMPMP